MYCIILEIFLEQIKRPETSQDDVKWWTSPENPLTPSTVRKPEQNSLNSIEYLES